MTNIPQDVILELAKEAGLEISGEFLGEPAYVAIESMIVTFAQLIEARLAARSDDRQRNEYVSVNQQAEAWQAIMKKLNEVVPDWHNYSHVGIECALAAIDKLTSPQQAIPAELVPYAWIYTNNDDGRSSLPMLTRWNSKEADGFTEKTMYMTKDGTPIDSAAPTAPIDNVREAYEKAAKICDAQSKRHADRADQEDDESECSVLKSTAWQFSIAAHDIRALIPSTQAPNTSGVRDGTK